MGVCAVSPPNNSEVDAADESQDRLPLREHAKAPGLRKSSCCSGRSESTDIVLPRAAALEEKRSYATSGLEPVQHHLKRSLTSVLTQSKTYRTQRDDLAWFQFLGDSLWPHAKQAVESFILGDLSDLIRSMGSDIPGLAKFKFSKCDFGERTPVFGPLVVRESVGFVEVGVEMNWRTDATIEVDVGGLKAGMKELTIRGAVLVVICPLLDVLPIAGGVNITFPNPPELNWTWTGLSKALPEKTIRSVIRRALTGFVVIPNRIFVDIVKAVGIPIPQAEEMKLTKLQSPRPLGVLRIELVEALDLLAGDIGGLSDPYAVISIGAGEFTSKVIAKTLNPKWLGGYEAQDFPVYHLEQEVSVRVYDEDRFSSDEFLGAIFMFAEDGCKRRPTVADMLEHDPWWPLDISHSKQESKHSSRVFLRCSFASVDSGTAAVSPNLVNCPGRHGLCHASGGKRAIACSLCDSGLSKSWRARLGLARNSDASSSMRCKACDFVVCDSCWVRRRPSCGLLSVTLRTAHVPTGDAERGVVVTFEFEEQTHHSQRSRLSKKEKASQDSRDSVKSVKVVNNLHSHGLAATEIARCLLMPLDEVERHLATEVCSQSRKLAASSSQGSLQSVGSNSVSNGSLQPVTWDETFHFLVRDPGEQSVLHLSYAQRTEGFLFSGSRKLLGQQQLWAAHTAGVLQAFDCEQVFRVIDEASQETIDLFVDVRLEPLMWRSESSAAAVGRRVSMFASEDGMPFGMPQEDPFGRNRGRSCP